jgi:uncharacterized membrane protein YwzB
VVSIIFLLFIHFISYWFVKISELTEFFKNPQCTQIQCNVKFVNDRLKDAFIWIPYLEKNIEIIEANLPQQLNVENFETFEPFENSNDCKISQPRILNQFGKIETIYRKIYDKQVKMKNMLTKFEKNIKFPAKNINENCFQIENAQECHSDTLKTQIANIYHKLDEIEYRNDRTYKKIERHYKRLIEYEKKRDLAIGEVANKANDVMKNLIGIPVDLKLGDHLKAGISKDMKANLQSAMSGDISKLTNLVNSPDIQNMAKMINPVNLFGKLSGSKPSDSTQFSDKGKNLIGNALNDEEDEDAVKAKSKMASSKNKIKLPSAFSNIF